MTDGFLIVAGPIAAGMALIASILGRRPRREKESPGKVRLRRGGGRALLNLQGAIEPSVEFVFQAQGAEQVQEEDGEGSGEGEEAIRSGLAEALGRSPVDVEEGGRHLAVAARAGLDWKALYEQAVADELRERPYRAPSVPPAGRVRPRE